MATERSSLLYGAVGSASRGVASDVNSNKTSSRTARASAIAALLGVAGVTAYASGAVPVGSLSAARLGFVDQVDAESETSIKYPDDPLGWVRSQTDLNPAFLKCAYKETPDPLVTAAYGNNAATCVSIRDALDNSQCVRDILDDDCVQNAYVNSVVSDGCADGADVEALKAPEWLQRTSQSLITRCPAFPPTDPEDGNYTNTVSGASAQLGVGIDPALPHRFATAKVVAEKNAKHAKNVASSLGADKGQPDYHGPWQGYTGQGLLPDTPPVTTVAKGNNPTSTFQLLTQCKTEEVKYLNPEFWFSPIAGAYIVRHNFGNPDMFSFENALKMERAELSDGVYGYTLATDQVDFEYGFALQNKNGEVWYENGMNPAPLFGEPCSQMYGSFYNRIAPNDGNKQFVFGDCAHECAADWRDEAYCRQPLTGEISADPSTPTVLGPVDDARLIVIGSAVLFGQTSDINPSGRSECLRDTTFRDNDGEARWVCGTVDYTLSKLKMVGVTITRASDGNAYAAQTFTKAHSFSNAAGNTYDYTYDSTTHSSGSCKNAACSASKYPLGPIAAGSPDVTGIGLTRLEYVTLAFGDAPPLNKFIDMNDNFLTPNDGGRKVLRRGEWGEDMDVRRIIPKNAALCGNAIYYANCFMMGKAYGDTSFTPTKFEKRWIFVIVEHVYFKMIRISVTYNPDDGAVYMKVVDAGYISHVRDANDIDTSDSMAYDVSDRYARRNYMPVAECFAHLCGAGESPGGYGIGAIKFDIASEMSASLREHNC